MNVSLQYFIGKVHKKCFRCSGCTAKECGVCKHCLDKSKYGGPGIKKQCCVKRKCIMIHESSNTKMELATVCITDVSQVFYNILNRTSSLKTHRHSYNSAIDKY